MSESIIIEIKDGIDNSIVAKINGIAKAARTAHSEIAGFSKQFDSLNKAAAAVNKLQIENERLAAATHRADAAALAAAVNEQRLAAARARTAAETSKATQAALRLSEAQSRSADRAAKVATAQKAAAEATANQSKQFDRARLSVKQYNAAMRGVPAQITDIVVSLQGGQAPLNVLLQQGGQLKDMFGGIRPAVAALGSELLKLVRSPLFLATAAVGAFALAVGSAESQTRKLNALTAQFRATGRSDVDQTFIGQFRKELSEIPGVSKSASEAIISEFAKVRTITTPIFKEAATNVKDLAVALGVETPQAAETLAEALGDPLKGAIELDKKLGFLTVQNFKTIDSLIKLGKTTEAQKVILDALKGSIGGLAEQSMTPLQKATDRLGNAWNKFTGTLSDSSILRATANLLGKLVDVLTWIVEKLDALFSLKAPEWLTRLAGGSNTPSVGKPAIPQRTAEQQMSTDIKLKQAGIKKDSGATKAESRATALAKINLQLQNELRLLEMLGDERQKEEMFSRIEESLIGRNIQLRDEETAAIRAQIERIVEMNRLSSERNRISEEAVSPLRDYTTTLKAAKELLDDEIISQKEYNKQVSLAEEAYQKATNPLFEYSRGLQDQLALTKFLGNAYEDQAELQRVLNDLRSRGITISDASKDALLEEIILIRQANQAHAAQNNLINQSVTARQQQAAQIKALADLTRTGKGGFTAGDSAQATSGILQQMGIDPSGLKVGLDAQLAQFELYYEQLKMMRQSKLISEQDFARAEAQIWMKEQEARFAQTRGFFTQLEGLQNSKSRKMQAIGKAAAISKAIIDTYTAATGAYASLASIPYVGPALGAAAAAAAITAGMANVQAIRSQGNGYLNGGYTGDGPRNDVAGPVHRREFVFDAAATDRIGVDNLEAMRSGHGMPAVPTESATMPQRQGNQNIRVINILDPALVGDYLATPEGEQVLVNSIRRNSDSVKSAINNG